jgi:phosphoribosylformylglycinamidine synthase
MRATVIEFLGSNCDHDMVHYAKDVFNLKTEVVWFTERDLKNPDIVLLPGGFSYGDYLRPGAMAARTPAMESVKEFAKKGGLVLGVCNGFQILCESGLLPGALLRNRTISFICDNVYLKAENKDTPFTCKVDKILKIPIAHGDGNYFCDEETLKKIESEGRVAFRYVSPEGEVDEKWNFNGAINSIAGVLSENRRVLGMMPHPERACEKVLNSEDGKLVMESVISFLEKNR